MNEKIENQETSEVETNETTTPKRNYFSWWTGATLATKITFIRLALIPLIMFFYIGANEFYNSDFFFYWGKIVALILFIIAAATDYLDGWIARKFDQVSDTGKLFDPIADKLLVLTGVALIVTDPFLISAQSGFLPSWVAIFIIFIPVARDTIIAIIRQLALNKGIVIGADKVAKAKSIFMFIALSLFMLYAANVGRISNYLIEEGLFLDLIRYTAWSTMIVALALTIISGVNYVVKFQKGQSAEVESTD